ncbi:MAG: hypothetical protein LV481_12460 [Methylacidiphilales bacterium]|nr:hypothetical protein [Candidatus Methylacidiphilales bacterium]
MRWLYVLVIIGASFLPALAENAPQPSAFTELKDALAFIDHELDAEDWNGLSHALYPALQPNEENRTDWTQLKDRRGDLRLVNIFVAQEFPSNDTTYLIRVPNTASIGGSRIRFIKSDNGWYLNAIYRVR